MNIAKRDVVEASRSLQLCAGQKSGSEAAIHAVHRIFQADDTDAVLLIDAFNAFNSINWAAALHNIRVLCPIIAVYAINTYQQSVQLFITGDKEIILALKEQLRVTHLLWGFKDIVINVTVEGQKHLGAVIGSRDFLENYVSEKVDNWVIKVAQLAEFAQAEPQASYAVYTFGLKHRWTYFLRTLPDIQDLLEPLEEAIDQVLIPAIVERKCSQLDSDVLALPVRLGGLGMANPCHKAACEHASSIKDTSPLIEQIMNQLHQLPEDSLVNSLHQAAKSEKAKELTKIVDNLKQIAL